MLSLSRNRTNVPVVRRRLLFRTRTYVDSTIAPVEADAVDVLVDHGGVVNIVNFGDVDVHHRAVIEKVSAVPTSAFKTQTEISEAVIDPTVEANVRTPVTVVEIKSAVTPPPVARSPKESNLRSQNPGPGHPVIIA